MDQTIKLAVVIGGHPYDVPAFRALFDSMSGLDVFIQDLDSWAASVNDAAFRDYGAVLFYNMNYWEHLSIRDDMDDRIKQALATFPKSGQGVVVLHHALLSFNGIDSYARICNVENRRIRGFGKDAVPTHVENDDHPITRGIHDWVVQDEYFEIDSPAAGSTILLTTPHPASTHELAWTHENGKSRVFCYQSGHGESAYSDPTYREVVLRGIRWVARRL